METFCLNLNIHWSLPDRIWEELSRLYAEMPGWKGMVDGAATWYGEDERIIEASSEPSGLQFYARMPEGEWQEWIEEFKSKATALLGYEIGEPEDGYEFKYFEGGCYI